MATDVDVDTASTVHRTNPHVSACPSPFIIIIIIAMGQKRALNLEPKQIIINIISNSSAKLEHRQQQQRTQQQQQPITTGYMATTALLPQFNLNIHCSRSCSWPGSRPHQMRYIFEFHFLASPMARLRSNMEVTVSRVTTELKGLKVSRWASASGCGLLCIRWNRCAQLSSQELPTFGILFGMRAVHASECAFTTQG